MMYPKLGNNLDIEKGLEELEGASSRVDVDQKQMINCRADVNQLVPFQVRLGLAEIS